MDGSNDSPPATMVSVKRIGTWWTIMSPGLVQDDVPSHVATVSPTPEMPRNVDNTWLEPSRLADGRFWPNGPQ